MLHAYPVTAVEEKQHQRPWRWWREEAFWRDVTTKTVSALLHSLILAVVGALVWKPFLVPWVLGIAITGLVGLGVWNVIKRVRAHRAALRLIPPPRHLRSRPPHPRPQPRPRNRPPVPRPRRTPDVTARPALFLAMSAAAALLVGTVLEPAAEPNQPVHENKYEGKWYETP